MDLSKYIGETTQCEKKEKLETSKPKSWLKSVSAFANGIGGVIIFGISDKDELIGLEDYKKDSEKISEIIKTKMDPTPQINLVNYTNENKSFIILEVKSGDETPYYIVDGGNRASYIRVGNQSVVASSTDLRGLVLKGINKTFDTLATDIKVENATFKELKVEYKKRTGKIFEEKDLLSFGLITSEGYLTYAGGLLSDNHALYQSRVFCTRWNGLTKANGIIEAIDDKEYSGNILYLLEHALDFVEVNTKKMWRKGPIYREEYPEYPIRAVEEAIVNALIHRDYGVVGSEIHIDIFDDRLEIYSPGGMYNGTLIQDKDLNDVPSCRRNPILADIFGRMGLMERRGSGLRKIVESYEREEMYDEKHKPRFKSTKNEFFTILKNLNYDLIQESKKDEVKIIETKMTVEERLKKIINAVSENPTISKSELAKCLNVAESTVKRDIVKLREDGRIDYQGGSKQGKWVKK